MGSNRSRLLFDYGPKLALVCFSVLLSLATFEIGWRAWRGTLFDWSNLAERRFHSAPDPSKCGHGHEALLGWAPTPGHRSPDFNVDDAGFRKGAPPPRADAPVLLAVGDSFTTGDEVGDLETYPSFLQGMVDLRVVNAGVSGFGLDQIVLRTERATLLFRPSAIIVGIIADDLRRIEYSVRWGMNAPYFRLTGSDLQLANVPVPPQPPCGYLATWHRIFGWSLLVNETIARLGLVSLPGEDRVLPEGGGRDLACPLFARLARSGVPTLVVAHYDRDLWGDDEQARQDQLELTRLMLNCASMAGLPVFDLFTPLSEAIRGRGVSAFYRDMHYSPEGNRYVARQIATQMKTQLRSTAFDSTSDPCDPTARACGVHP